MKRGKTAAAQKRDSINNEHEANESAEKKVLSIWKAFDQIFGLRWAQSFGNDPLGREKPENRMEQWIETAKFMGWDRVNTAINKIRMAPKPYEGWLPDLQSFIQFAGKPPQQAETIASSTWVDKVCTSFMMAWAFQFPVEPKSEYEEALGKVYMKMRKDFNEMLREEPDLEPLHVAKSLCLALSKVPAPHIPKEQMETFRKNLDATVQKRLEQFKKSSATKERSSS